MLFSFTGEYVKDVDFLLLPQDPLMDLKFPRPVVERGYCFGIFNALEEKNRDDTGKIGNRDCDSGDYLQPLADFSSRVCKAPRKINLNQFFCLENDNRSTKEYLQSCNVL